METNYQFHQTPYFGVLSEMQMKKIYQATLEVLTRTGVNVYNEEARHLLEKAGAEIEGVRAYIPPHIIQDAVAVNPRSFSLWHRDGKQRMQIVPDQVYFGPGPSCTYFIDPTTGETRKVQRGDPATVACVCDALPHIDYVMGLGLIGDAHPRLAPVYEFAEMVTNTVKPVLAWAYSPENVSDIYQIALALAGSERNLRRRPFFALFSTFQPPLQHTDEDLANALWAAEHDIPIIYLGGGVSGATAPITGAGTLVIALAGALSGLAIIQLKRRGTPVCIGAVPNPVDLRTGRPSYGGPETSLYSAALADLARYLALPFMGTAGASESKVLDLQAAIESAVQIVLSGLSGAALVHDVGFLNCAEVGSLEMLVMSDEIISMVRRILRGIEVNDKTLMLDEIDRVGPGGEFMSSKETARLCRSEIWVPNLMDRDMWTNWQASGEKTMTDRIKERLQKILDAHDPPPLPDGAAERIDDIIKTAEARLQKS